MRRLLVGADPGAAPLRDLDATIEDAMAQSSDPDAENTLVEDAELEWYAFAPVRCGAECDSPIIQAWDYDTAGRHAQRSDTTGDPLLASGGC